MPVAFETRRAVVAAGDGIVARLPGIICVAHCVEPGPIGRLLELCASASGPAPGRALTRLLAIWMSGPDNPGDALRFGTLADAGEHLAVFLVGTVDAWVDGPEGTVLSGADAAIGTDRLLPLPTAPVVLSLGEIDLPVDVDDVHDLRSGVVAGGGIVLHPAPAPAAEPDDDAAGPGVPAPAPAPDNGQGPVEDSHDWFADLGSPAEPGAGDAPAPEHADAAPSTHRNGAPPATNGTASRESARDAAPPAPASGPGEQAVAVPPWADPIDASGRHAFLDRYAPPVAEPRRNGSTGATPDDDEPTVGINGHDALDPGSDAGPPVLGEAAPGEAVSAGTTPAGTAFDRTAAAGPELDGPGFDGTGFDGAEFDGRAPAGTAFEATAFDGTAPAGTAFDGTAFDGTAPAGTAFDGTAFDGAAPAGTAFDGTVLHGMALDGTVPDGEAGEAASGPGPAGPSGPPTAVPDHDLFAAPAAADGADAVMEGDDLATPPTGAQPDPYWADADGPEQTEVAVPAQRTNGHLPDEPQVRGYACDHGHLNDPRAPFCVQCGAPIDDRTAGLVSGSRPSLGLLVFDDGATYSVDDGYLVGRMPESDDRVRDGGLRPIILEDRTGSVSRVHAEIQVAGWDVMLLDAGSRNGTFVAGPDDAGWSPLPPQRGRRLLPGTRVRLGGRTFVFESTSGMR